MKAPRWTLALYVALLVGLFTAAELVAILRISVAIALLVSVVILPVLIIWRPQQVRRCTFAAAVAMLILAAVPVDLSFTRTGHVSVGVRPILWGLPTRESMFRIRAGELAMGGCVVPLNPARYAVLLTW